MPVVPVVLFLYRVGNYRELQNTCLPHSPTVPSPSITRSTPVTASTEADYILGSSPTLCVSIFYFGNCGVLVLMVVRIVEAQLANSPRIDKLLAGIVVKGLSPNACHSLSKSLFHLCFRLVQIVVDNGNRSDYIQIQGDHNA
jgi:hypothetical protein